MNRSTFKPILIDTQYMYYLQRKVIVLQLKVPDIMMAKACNDLLMAGKYEMMRLKCTLDYMVAMNYNKEKL